MRILVALSGGIDSSVVAHMLRDQGHELVGVRFTLWSDPLAPPIANILPSKCCNTQTAFRAKSTAEKLAIPYHIIDLEKEFKENVVDPFLEGYRAGVTPNPCIGCNRTIKFGKLLELTKQFECDAMATGHYARVAMETLSDGTKRHVLLESIDPNKDQSYYLYGLSQEQLSRVLFPIGSMLKSDVFALAKHYDVPFDEEYRESQDLCFFPEKEPADFLRRHLADVIKPGKIVRKDGVVVGEHKGLPLYTVGQRQGLGIGGLKIPLEVVEKHASTNELIVAERGTATLDSIGLRDMRWVSWKPEEGTSMRLECRVRSLSPKKQGMLTFSGATGKFTFEQPQSPLAPGQSLVLYKGEEVVGGGVMVAAE